MGADLRAYRRQALPERMLVLLLDHTCRHGWDWLPALAPYLQRAYGDRAAVCLVEGRRVRRPGRCFALSA